MTKFMGEIGYGDSVETSPGSGIWEDVITEVSYFGDVTRNSVSAQESDHLNRDLRVHNSISIVADAYANEHFFAIRYVRWAGALWTVESVTVERPRLTLRLGEVYNGPTA